MNNRDEFLIEQYFSRRITPAEQTELEQRIADDAGLADQFRFQQITAAAVIKNERTRMKAMLQEAEKKSKPRSTIVVPMWSRYAAAAAAFALLLVALPGVRKTLFGPGQVEARKIEFVPYPNEFSVAAIQTVETQLDSASAAYKAQNYRLSANIFGRIEPQKPAYVFYHGVSLVGAGDFDKAIEVLTPIAQDKQSDYYAPAQYFIAEAYWKSNNRAAAVTAAKAYLETPEKKSESVFRANAKAMIDQAR